MSAKHLIGVTVVALALPLFSALPSFAAAATPTAAPVSIDTPPEGEGPWFCPPRICH